jgi:hypothetical protein
MERAFWSPGTLINGAVPPTVAVEVTWLTSLEMFAIERRLAAPAALKLTKLAVIPSILFALPVILTAWEAATVAVTSVIWRSEMKFPVPLMTSALPVNPDEPLIGRPKKWL